MGDSLSLFRTNLNPFANDEEPRDPSSFVSMFEDLRKKRNLTMTDVAHRAGLNVSSVSRIQAGNRHPEMETLRLIVEAMGLEVVERNRLFAAAGYMPEDLNGIVDPLTVSVEQVLVSIKGQDHEQAVRGAIALIVKAAA